MKTDHTQSKTWARAWALIKESNDKIGPDVYGNIFDGLIQGDRDWRVTGPSILATDMEGDLE